MRKPIYSFVTNDGGAVLVQSLMALRRGEVVAVQWTVPLAIGVTSLCHSLALQRCCRLAPCYWHGQPRYQCYHVFV